MKIKKIIVIAIAGFSSLFAHAQTRMTDTTFVMKEVEIFSSRLKSFAVGANVQKFDSLMLENYAQQSFADLINSQSIVSMSTYGSGGLSLPSIRAGGATHTAVIWNGVNIQSPMNESTNMALLPVGLFGEINIQHGGSGTLLGNGAMSGAIHLESGDLFSVKDQLVLGTGVGSFGYNNLNAGLKISNEKIAASIKVYHNETSNDFKFKNIAKYKQPVEKQTNAGYRQLGMILENKIKTGKNSFLNATIWVQDYDKNLQTLMIDSDTSKSVQNDRNIYSIFRWQHTGEKIDFQAKSALIRDIEKFNNPSLPDSVTNNKALSFINEAEIKWALNDRQIINYGINYTHEAVNSEGYKGFVTRDRVSFFISYKLIQLFDCLNIVNSFRKEIVDKGNLPLVYSMDADYEVLKWITVKGNISKNYNLPSLNDLYWRNEAYVSGNPDLKPESGWSGEFGFWETLSDSRLMLKTGQSFYYSKINDWIVWLPGEGGVWTPDNKKTAKISGLDFSLNSRYPLNRLILSLNAKYNWNRSLYRNESTNYLPMIYVPKNTFVLSLSASYKRFNIAYSHKFVGKRLYDTDHELSSYHLAGIDMNVSIPVQRQLLVLSFKVHNLLNENYQVMAWYAMPPVNYQLSVAYHFNNLTLK